MERTRNNRAGILLLVLVPLWLIHFVDTSLYMGKRVCIESPCCIHPLQTGIDPYDDGGLKEYRQDVLPAGLSLFVPLPGFVMYETGNDPPSLQMHRWQW